MSSTVEIEVCGESLEAHASRSLFWRAESTLFVADVHLGKAASFRANAVPVPSGTTRATLNRLDRSLEETGAQRLILLGDLWHDPKGRTGGVEAALTEWREKHRSVEVVLVRGNHDRRAGECRPEVGIAEVDELLTGPFLCRHHPEESAAGYVLAGHIHPALSLAGRAGDGLTLPCFWFREAVGVLPAFGEFTGASPIEPEPGDSVVVVGAGQVFAVQRPARSGGPRARDAAR